MSQARLTTTKEISDGLKEIIGEDFKTFEELIDDVLNYNRSDEYLIKTLPLLEQLLSLELAERNGNDEFIGSILELALKKDYRINYFLKFPIVKSYLANSDTLNHYLMLATEEYHFEFINTVLNEYKHEPSTDVIGEMLGRAFKKKYINVIEEIWDNISEDQRIPHKDLFIKHEDRMLDLLGVGDRSSGHEIPATYCKLLLRYEIPITYTKWLEFAIRNRNNDVLEIIIKNIEKIKIIHGNKDEFYPSLIKFIDDNGLLLNNLLDVAIENNILEILPFLLKSTQRLHPFVLKKMFFKCLQQDDNKLRKAFLSSGILTDVSIMEFLKEIIQLPDRFSVGMGEMFYSPTIVANLLECCPNIERSIVKIFTESTNSNFWRSTKQYTLDDILQHMRGLDSQSYGCGLFEKNYKGDKTSAFFSKLFNGKKENFLNDSTRIIKGALAKFLINHAGGSEIKLEDKLTLVPTQQDRFKTLKDLENDIKEIDWDKKVSVTSWTRSFFSCGEIQEMTMRAYVKDMLHRDRNKYKAICQAKDLKNLEEILNRPRLCRVTETTGSQVLRQSKRTSSTKIT